MGVQQIVEAIPTIVSGDGPNGDDLRTELISGLVGVIPDDTSVSDGVLQEDPADAALGGVRQVYFYGDGAFKYDPNDETTEHDGVFVLVLIGGRRYTRLGVPTIGAVLSRTVETPPDPDDVDPEARPSYGDAYLFLTGSWAAEGIGTNSIAVWSSLGGGSWQEVEPRFGPPLFVRDEKLYIHWEGDDGWVDGVGRGSYQTETIPLSAIIGCSASFVLRAVNQTTNSPPATWSKGAIYIIGSSASGDWSGQAGKVAIAETDGVLADGDTFTIYTPATGDRLFDISLGYPVEWSGAAWRAATGATVNYTRQYTAASVVWNGGNMTYHNGTVYSGFPGTLPTTSAIYVTDDVTVSCAAIATGSILKIRYKAYGFFAESVQGDRVSSDQPVVAVLFRDSETTAVDMVLIGSAAAVRAAARWQIDVEFTVTPSDNSSHTYKFGVVSGHVNNSSTDIEMYLNTVARREFEIKEIVST